MKTLLADADPSPRATLAAHLERVDTQLAAGRALRARLVEAINSLDEAGRRHDDVDTAVATAVDTEQLMKVIEKMTMFDQHLTTQQQEWFARRRQQVGEQTWQQSLHAWPELIDAVRAEMDAGTDPTHPRVQELMTRWAQLQQVFLDDDPEMRTASGQAWQAMWGQHPDQLRQSPRLSPPQMWDSARPRHRAHWLTARGHTPPPAAGSLTAIRHGMS